MVVVVVVVGPPPQQPPRVQPPWGVQTHLRGTLIVVSAAQDFIGSEELWSRLLLPLPGTEAGKTRLRLRTYPCLGLPVGALSQKALSHFVKVN